MNYDSIIRFFQEEIDRNKEFCRAFFELKEAATFGRLSSRKLAELIKIDSGDADELVSSWTKVREDVESQADNGDLATTS